MNSFSLLTLGVSVILNNRGNIEAAYRYTRGVQLCGLGRLYTYFFNDVAPNYNDALFFQISNGTDTPNGRPKLWYGSLTGKGIAENAWDVERQLYSPYLILHSPYGKSRITVPFQDGKIHSVSFFKEGEKGSLVLDGVRYTTSFPMDTQLREVPPSEEPQIGIYRQDASAHEWNAAYYYDGYYNLLFLPMIDTNHAYFAVYGLGNNTLIEL